MAKTEYTIKGTSTTRPEGLPEGFEIVETPIIFDKETEGFQLTDSAHYEERLFIKQDPDHGRHFSRNAVIALRDALSEWLDESAVSLRVIHDASDSAGSSWRWYEIDTDQFAYHLAEDAARREAYQHREGKPTKGTLTFDQIKSDYGIRSIVSWKV